MVAFWDHGYRATSLQDLVDTMGINRASLYDTFGDKYTLFLKTLNSYNDNYVKPYIAERKRKYSPRQAVVGMFDDICDRVQAGEDRNGCFIINTALELSPHDKEVSKIVNRTFVYIEKNFFRKMIIRGQASGEIAKSVVPSTASRVLLSLFLGLRVLSRNRPEKVVLNAIKSQVDALLPPGENVALSHNFSRSLRRQGRKVFHDTAQVA
ncbi:MAG: TetR/AcrR family transcriptional regulator [Nitrospira sp. SB0662_bin_26]|nr:TetR/AcrR family transcriptional regulator [Nitrospira sp. SB0662_bin_26]